MGIDWYILDANKNPVKSTPEGFTDWCGPMSRYDKKRVAWTDVADGVSVSTVFLGLDHGFDSDKPVLFETMVFGGPLDQEQERFCTWAEAVDGHERVVGLVKHGRKF